MCLIVGKSTLFEGQLARAADHFTVISHFREFSNHQRMFGDCSQAFSTMLSTTVLIEPGMNRDRVSHFTLSEWKNAFAH